MTSGRSIILTSVLLLASFFQAFGQWDKDMMQYRGRMALSEGRWSDAIAQFNLVTRLDTSDHRNFFFRGIAKYNLGDLRGAREDFDRSVRINPLFTDGYHYRAVTKSRSGLYDEALEDLGKAISLRPGFAGLYFSRGVTYFLSQRFDEALEDFNRYLRQQPKDPSAYLNRGACLLFLKDTVQALSDYNRAIRLDRFEAEGYIRRGRLYAAQENYRDGIRDMDQAIRLDPEGTFAYFNRALMRSETGDFKGAMADLDKVLEDEPGNALTLYNRALLKLRLEDYEGALDDMDRVIVINPGNVLALFNRAACNLSLSRWEDAVDDYTRAIELYPDFAKAYQNRAYAESVLGRSREAKRDYATAKRKIDEYNRSASDGHSTSFADTARRYNSLIAFDAPFAKSGFEDEDVRTRDIRLRPLYRWTLSEEGRAGRVALRTYYEDKATDDFRKSLPVPAVISSEPQNPSYAEESTDEFIRALGCISRKLYNSALAHYDRSVTDAAEADTARAFRLMNRAVLKAEMTEFIASMESNVQTLTLDDKGAARARVSDRVQNSLADYSDALSDLKAAAEILPGNAYIQYNLGNLHCLSSSFAESVASYDRAVKAYPSMGDAWYNRGLVLIILKDREKGCISLSRAGELGVGQAYGVINKYCKPDES